MGYELNASGSTANHYKFTGKERDAESNLDYFGAGYYGGTQGRFMTPDAPFADQHPDDPQSWNLYSYVRNNPHSYVDPSGNACFALNRGSAYCARASEYGKIDAQVSNKTRFFAAASAVSQSLANTDITIASRVKVSGSSQGFLSRLGSDLRIMNVGIAASIKNGSLGGENLDARIVHMEQTKVQESLDDLKKSSADEYNTLIAEANAALNPTGLSRDASTFLDTDKAFMQVLDEVRRDLGRDIDFSKQSDREAIGNALIEHVRKTGGCDVAGDKLKGC